MLTNDGVKVNSYIKSKPEGNPSAKKTVKLDITVSETLLTLNIKDVLELTELVVYA